jgi:DnaD/phage-associated family protein
MLILMKASHDDHKFLFNGVEVPVTSGQMVTGAHALASEFNDGVPPDKAIAWRTLWRWLKKFEKSDMLTISSNARYSVITVSNWGEYQSGDKPVTSSRQSNDKLLSTYKNQENYKNDKKVVVGESDSVNLSKVSDQWANLWGFPNPVARQDLYSWVREFGTELVGWVIDYAARRDVQSKGANRYLDRVFDGYRQRGITTVAAAEDEAKKHEEVAKANAPRPQRHYGRPKREEQTPEWAQPDYKPAPEHVDDKTKADLAAQLAEFAKRRAAAKKEEPEDEYGTKRN